jgi:hypothetical protein
VVTDLAFRFALRANSPLALPRRRPGRAADHPLAATRTLSVGALTSVARRGGSSGPTAEGARHVSEWST